MAEDIEQRLAEAAATLREYEVVEQRLADLRARLAATTAERDALRAQLAEEQKDVERLEGLSLTRVLASLRGARDDALARERAEADAAQYRVASAQAMLDAVQREHDAVSARLGQLAGAPAAYAAVLAEKERHLSASADPRGRRLLELAEERGRIHGELHEVAEALQAAEAARHALTVVQDELGSASGWSTYDTFLGGGMISSSIKHSRLDKAANAAAYADQRLGVLRTELADVGGVGLTVPQLMVDGLTRFADIWLDNIFTDLAVRDQIKQAQQHVAHSLQLVGEVQRRLRQREAQAGARLAAIDTERHEILTRG
ncbi:MAG TPA: hypothetical protein VGR21_11180 [Cryptosporangiaceae bacterium]|nr:hypothetical protein [Cryptosporangiaceae bacterium]